MKLIHPDATLLLRPKTNLNDMIVEVDPGSGKEHIEDGAPLPALADRTEHPLRRVPLDPRRRHPAVPAAARRRRRAGDRRPRPPALRRLPPPAALRPLHRRPQPRRRPAPRRAGPGDPQLRPADHRTRPPRHRDRTLRHLLQGRARQLRQPAAVDPGGAGRVPGDPAPPLRSALASSNRFSTAARPALIGLIPQAQALGPALQGQRALLQADDRADPRPDPSLHPPDPPGPDPPQRRARRTSRSRCSGFGELARRLQQLPQRARLQAEGQQGELPLLPALAQPRPQRHLQPHRRAAGRSGAAW